MAFVPTTPSETREWLLRFHEANDSLDASRLPTIYSKDIQMQFGNSPTVHGLDALAKHLEKFWPGLDMMHHEIDEFDIVGNNKIYQSCQISFRAKNDPEKELVKVPGMAVLHLVTSGEEAGLVRRAQYYLDVSPLLATLARAG